MRAAEAGRMTSGRERPAMKVLAIDTSTDWPAVGLSTGPGRTWAAAPAATRRHGRDLVPAIRDLLVEAGIRAGEFDLIGVGLGPGSYTGLRIGLTAAKVLAYASGAALIGLDSLEAVAQEAPPDALRVVAVADAQRGDVYTAEFRRDAPRGLLVPTEPSRVEPLERWSARLGAPAAVVGPGLASDRIRAAMPPGNAVAQAASAAPRAATLLELTARYFAAGRRDDLWALEPNYLRRSAAEDQWTARGQA
jgi:tRNA threonylcarbamoyladenosine biosynthesis protein TsaB